MRTGGGAVAVALLLLFLSAGRSVPAAPAADGRGFPPFVVLDETEGRSRESVILLRRDCRSDLGRREVTLFADGTVRLRRETAPAGRESVPGPVDPPGRRGRTGRDRDGGEGEGRSRPRLALERLDPDSFDAFRARLAEIDPGDEMPEREPVEGAWLERCALELRMEGRGTSGDRGPVRRFHFARTSRLPLELARIEGIADELTEIAERQLGGGLPHDYRPRDGDVLERLDGAHFRVIGRTEDGEGIELHGVEEPLVLYLTVDDLRARFVRLVSSGRAGKGGGGGR